MLKRINAALFGVFLFLTILMVGLLIWNNFSDITNSSIVNIIEGGTV